MVLRMKNFNTVRVHWKIRLLRGEGTKNQYREGKLQKWRLGLFADLRGEAWQERGGDFFEGGLRPQCTLWSHYEETVYFLPVSPQEYLVLVSSISKGWKVDSTLEPLSDFEIATPGLGIQHLNHYVIASTLVPTTTSFQGFRGPKTVCGPNLALGQPNFSIKILSI